MLPGNWFLWPINTMFNVVFVTVAAVLVLFSALYAWFMLDSVFRAHDLPTSKKAVREIAAIIRLHNPNRKVFVDLGCARGLLAARLKKKFPAMNVRAVDTSAFRIFVARVRAFFMGVFVVWEKRNIFDADVSNTDIVYTYLWYDLMPPLEQKLLGELKKGAIVITNTSSFPNWKPQETYITCSRKPDFEKLFVYLKN